MKKKYAFIIPAVLAIFLLFAGCASSSGAIHRAIKKGDGDKVKEMIDRQPELIKARNREGYTPLHQAALCGNTEVVKILLEKGAALNAADSGGNTALHLAAAQGNSDMVKLLVEMGFDVTAKNNRGDSAFARASAGGHKEVADYLEGERIKWERKLTDELFRAIMDDKVDNVNALLQQAPELIALKGPGGMSALHMAAMLKSTKMITVLLSHSAEVNAADDRGYSPLHHCAERGQAEAAKLLTEHGAKINEQSMKEGYAPLHLAVKSQSVDTVGVLVTAGADLNTRDKQGKTPLDYAVEAGNNELVEILCSYGADKLPLLTAKIHEAIKKGDLKGLKVLLQENPEAVDAPEQVNRRTPLHIAAVNGDLQLAQLLLAHGAKVNAVDKAKNTPLHCACGGLYSKEEAKNPALVKLLLQKGARVNAGNCSGETPLHHAAQSGLTSIAALLVENGADLNAAEEFGKTPLHWAIDMKQLEMVKLLLDRGADANARACGECSVLHYAAGDGSTEMVKLLLAHGAEVNARDIDGGTPYLYAINDGHRETAQVLRDHGAEIGGLIHRAAAQGDIKKVKALLKKNPAVVNQRAKDGYTPLLSAAETGQVEVVQLLLDSGADVKAWKKGRLSALHQAARCKKSSAPEVVKLLIAHEAAVNERDAEGYTPLHHAPAGGQAETVRLLLENKAAVNDKNCYYWKTPLHFTAEAGNREIALLLINRGAEINAKDMDERTPLHLAALGGNLPVARSLLEHKAAINLRDKEKCTPLDRAIKAKQDKMIKFLRDSGGEEGKLD